MGPSFSAGPLRGSSLVRTLLGDAGGAVGMVRRRMWCRLYCHLRPCSHLPTGGILAKRYPPGAELQCSKPNKEGVLAIMIRGAGRVVQTHCAVYVGKHIPWVKRSLRTPSRMLFVGLEVGQASVGYSYITDRAPQEFSNGAYLYFITKHTSMHGIL